MQKFKVAIPVGTVYMIHTEHVNEKHVYTFIEATSAGNTKRSSRSLVNCGTGIVALLIPTKNVRHQISPAQTFLEFSV